MKKIERRRTTVTLHHGHYQQELADLLEKAMAALRAEESGVAPQRAGTKRESMKLGKQYDDLLAEAEESATKITVWAIGHREYSTLADEHPPRPDDANDKRNGVNLKTFPAALLCASLVEPGSGQDGEQILDELDLSHPHYDKLERAAWSVNVGDDALGKSSLISLLKQMREPDSKPLSDSE